MSTPPPLKKDAAPMEAASDQRVILEGDDLLRELRQGWTGLPNKTLFSLALGGLRVRMMRSTVTMLSIVLAIAFLTYTGLSSTINYRLVVVAEALGDQSVSDAKTQDLVTAAATRLATADLLGALDIAAIKKEAVTIGLTRVSKEENDLPIAQRNFKRFDLAASDAQANYQKLVSSPDPVPADVSLAQSQRDMARKERDAAMKTIDQLQNKVTVARWVRSGELPENTSEQQMHARVQEIISKNYRELLQNINTPGKLSNESLSLVSRPIELASEAGLSQDATTLQAAVDRVIMSRQSESLLNMLRRSGVSIEKTREGNPMDVWLIVMALMTCAVGIANAMLMSVTERFREIGTMKCLGAQDNLVVKLFLLESAFLGVVGAAGGIVIGLTVSLLASVLQFGSFGITYFPVSGALPTIFWSVLGGVILSVVGAVYPAFAASRMKPVDALRVDE